MNYPSEGVALGRSIVQMEPKGRGSGLCLKTEVSVRSRRYLVWAENPSPFMSRPLGGCTKFVSEAGCISLSSDGLLRIPNSRVLGLPASGGGVRGILTEVTQPCSVSAMTRQPAGPLGCASERQPGLEWRLCEVHGDTGEGAIDASREDLTHGF